MEVLNRSPEARARNDPVEGRSTIVRPWLAVWGAVVLYAGYALCLTWPLVLEPGRRIFGATGDLTGGIATLRELVENDLNPFGSGRIHDFAAPDGRAVDWVLNVLSAPGVALRYALALPFGPVAAMNIYVLLGLVGSALAMFLFIRKLTGATGVAFVVGWAFGFSPWMVAQSREHPDFVHAWVLVILAWRTLVFIEQPNRRTGLLASAACFLAFSWTPYYVLLAGVLYVAVLAVGAARMARRRRWGTMSSYGWCAVGPGCFVLVIAAISFLGGESPAAANPLVELYTYSARSFEYVLPDAWNPLLGDLTGSYLDAHRHGSYKVEQSLYLGLSLLALAFVAVGLTLRDALERRRGTVRRSGLGTVVTAFTAVGATALIFSAPPTTEVFGFELRTPSWYVYEITTAWRVFARFGLVVMLAVCVLAAVGLASLLNGRSKKLHVALLALTGTAIVADLISIPPERTTALDVPAIYARLKSLPPGLAAEYPMARPPFYGDYNELLFQDAHDKPLMNGYEQDSPAEERVLALAKLPKPAAAPTFALVGVRYVVVRKASPLLGPGLFPPDTSAQGFRLVAEDSYAQLFRVDAVPRGSLVTFTKGFDEDEGGFRWMTSAEGELEVRAACDPCAGTLAFNAWSFARKRQLVVSASDGRVLLRGTVTPRRKTFRVPVRFRERLLLQLGVTPGDESVRSVVPRSHDTRSISIRVSDPPRFLQNSPLR